MIESPETKKNKLRLQALHCVALHFDSLNGSKKNVPPLDPDNLPVEEEVRQALKELCKGFPPVVRFREKFTTDQESAGRGKPQRCDQTGYLILELLPNGWDEYEKLKKKYPDVLKDFRS